MQFIQTRSPALPSSRALPYPPEWAAQPAAGGGAMIDPIGTAAPVFSDHTRDDPHELQAQWDRFGTIQRLRLIATTPVLRRELLILPALLLAGLAILPLIAAVLP